jgi:hypothetical protein
MIFIFKFGEKLLKYHRKNLYRLIQELNLKKKEKIPR